MRGWTPYMKLMPVLLAQALSSCSLIDEPVNDEIAVTTASLAFNVSIYRSATRMSDEITQQPKTRFRGIENLKLFPFDIEETIGTGKKPLEGMEYEMTQNEVVETNYFDDRSVKIPEGTKSFLCYAKAVPKEKPNETDSNFVNGIVTATGLDSVSLNTSNISFAPKVIHNSVEIVANDKPSKIATYLTEIANAIPNDKRDFFYKFVNKGHPVACSSTNVAKLAGWANTEAGVDLSSITSTYDSDYPANINLPDGAAVVRWNTTGNKFEPQSVTTTEVNINRLDRFIYPAELWYYANSRIKTSSNSQIENYDKSWDVILAGYERDNGVMDPSVHSVAIKDPLSYAVGCLQVGLVVSNTLTDANEETPKTITLYPTDGETCGTFPLRAVFVSGQYKQAFDFTPKDDITEYIIYDKEISGVTMGDAKTSTSTKYTNTLVFQTKDRTNVRFALEFENNSGEDFWGVNGMVFNGTKFYLVGTINVPPGEAESYKQRAFTKDYTTQGTVTISSLRQAYTYLPDLLDPRLEIGIKLVPTWIQSTTTNVPL